MEYLLGVLYVTKKYELLNASRPQPDTNVIPKLSESVGAIPVQTNFEGGDTNEDSSRDAAIPVNLTRRTTARPFSSPPFFATNTAEGSQPKITGVSATARVEISLSGKGEETATEAAQRQSAWPPNMSNPYRLPSSLQESAASASSPFLPPQESCPLSSILPGLSVSASAAAAERPAERMGTTIIPRPQSLEHRVPTKVLAGKYVLIYLPCPHWPNTAGQVAQLWGGSGGAGVTNSCLSSASCGTGGSAGGGGGGMSVGSRSGGPPTGPAPQPSPQMESLKMRLSGSASTSAPLPCVGQNPMSQGSGAGRPNFTAVLTKSSDPFSSGANSVSSYAHNLNAAAQSSNSQPLSHSVVRAAAAAATTHQQLLLFYILLLHRLAQRPNSEKASTTLLDNDEGLTLTTTQQVPVAVLELHYTTEGPLRNIVCGPAMVGGGAPAALDGHGGATPSVSSGGVVGGGGAGGAGGPTGAGGSGQHCYNLSPGASVVTFNHSALYGSSANGSGGGGGGRSTSAHFVSSTNSGGNTNVGGCLSSNLTSAMASPRLPTPGLGFASPADSSTRQADCAVNDVAVEPTASRLLGTILHHLQEGKPDARLSPENVVFNSEITQNPYYGGWYAVESNDGYRRVMQMCGVQSWPVVALVDPAGDVVTVSALQHIEEELTQFTADVEANLAKFTSASATTGTAAATGSLIPTQSSSPLPPTAIPEGQEVTANSPADAMEGGAGSNDDDMQYRPSQKSNENTCSAEEESGEGAQSPTPTVPRYASPVGTGTTHENHSDALISPFTASPRPVVQVETAAEGGKRASVTESSSTHPLTTTAEEATMEPQADDAEPYTPNQFHDSKSMSADLRESSIPFHDPQIPTAEPTPVKRELTARYHDESAISTTSLSEEVMSPRRGSNSDVRVPNVTQGFLSPSTVLQATSAATTVRVVSGRNRQKLSGEVRKHSDSSTGERENENTHVKSPSLSTQCISQLSMPKLLDSCPGKNVSGHSCLPAISSTIKDHYTLQSWNEKVYVDGVAGVINVHSINSENGTPVRTASQSPTSPKAQQQPLFPPPPEGRQQQQHRCQDSPPRVAVCIKDNAAATSPEKCNASVRPTGFYGHLPKLEISPSTLICTRDFSEAAAAAGASATVPARPAPLEHLPTFTSQFPWNLAMPEPIMLYATRTVQKHSIEESENESTLESVQLIFQRQLQERVTERKLRESPAGRAASPKTDLLTAANKDDAEAGVDCALDVPGGNFTDSGQTNVGISASTHPTITAPSSVSATLVMPASMVLRQSHANKSNCTSTGGGGASVLDDGEPSMPASADNAVPQAALVRLPKAQLKLTAFTATPPLVVMERSWSVHPLCRLVLSSITAEKVAARARSTAFNSSSYNNSNNIFPISGNDNRTDQSGSALPAAAVITSTNVAPSASPNSLVILSLSIEDSTDDDNHPSRSPSPPTHIAWQCAPRPHLSLENPQQQKKALSTLLDGWLQDATTKFDSATHFLLFFGAGWHPGMSKCVQALRRLQKAVNRRLPSDSRSTDGGDKTLSNGGHGVADRQGFDIGHDAAIEADNGGFATLNNANSNSVAWSSGRLGSLEGGGGGGGGRLDLHNLANFHTSVTEPMEDEVQSSLFGRASFKRRHMQNASPSGALEVESLPPPTDRVKVPCYRIQVIYISADESLEEVSRTVSGMPPHWLCLSPYIAQNTTERQLQRSACNGARRIFNVTSFPRVVVVELPSAQQARGSHSDATSKTSATGTAGGGIMSGADEDADNEASETKNAATMDAALCQQAELQFGGLWSVVQLHGETQLNADPEGKRFPWSGSENAVLHFTQDEISTLSHEGQKAWWSLFSGFRKELPPLPLQHLQSRQQEDVVTTSLHQSLMLGYSSPAEDDEVPLLLRSHSEMLATIDKGDGTPVAGDATSTTCTYSMPPMSPTRPFPPLKPFVVGDGELPMLLEKGGYFVVLGAFGSVDAQLHQQCVSALEEARTWFYAEVEARKEQAWSESTRLQVMAPHGTYATPFTVGSDRVLLSPAAVGNPSEEYSIPLRYSPCIPASAFLSSQGSASTPAGPRMLHGGLSSGGTVSSTKSSNNSNSTSRGATALFDEVWAESYAPFKTSPKFSLMSPPTPIHCGPGGLQLDGTTSVHSLQASHSVMGGLAGAGGTKATSACPLPSVFFYDSIFTNPHNAHTQDDNRNLNHHTTTATSLMAAASAPTASDNDGLMQVSTTLWDKTLSASAQRASTAAVQGSPPCEMNEEVSSGAVNVAFESPLPVPHVSDNTASLRRHHAKDLALLQEYVIAPIFENDEKMLPVREGEMYLALVRWPQRTAAVLRRRLTSEVRTAHSATTTTSATAASGATTVSGSGSSSAAPPSATVSSSSTNTSTARNTSASQPPGQAQMLPEALLRRQPGSPSPLSPTITATTGSGGASVSSHTGSQVPSSAVPSASHVAVTMASAFTADHNSPSLTAANVHMSMPTSLNATVRTEESGKEGSPDPDATPLASAGAIKSFLYEQILRSMAV